VFFLEYVYRYGPRILALRDVKFRGPSYLRLLEKRDQKSQLTTLKYSRDVIWGKRQGGEFAPPDCEK